MEYHNKTEDLHRRILKHILLSTELLLNLRDRDISEYDVQAFMSSFLKSSLHNTKYKAHRESFGKFDCAISQSDTKYPIILYEMKTFLKPNEKLLISSAQKKIVNDFKKLSKIKYENTRGYFILLCKRVELEKMGDVKDIGYEWLQNHFHSKKNWYDFGEFKLRPSTKEKIFETYALSWEVKRMNK